MPDQPLEEILEIESRAPGTDAERRTANLLREQLVKRGRQAELQAVYVHRSPETVQALHAILGVVASVVSAYLAPLGFALLLLVIASCYLDLSSRFYLLRRLLFRRGSQNVISPGNRPDARERIILVAGCDVPRTGWMKGSRAFEMRRRFPKRAHGWLGVYRVLLWAGLAPLLLLIGARLAGYDPTWITIVQILPTVILAVVAFLLIDSSLATPSPGASENASGVIACMDLAKRLDTSPVQHLDIWIVFAGGSTCFGEGMRSFFADKRLRDPERRTTVVELQAVGAGTICFRASQGAGIGVQPPERLVEALVGTPPATEPVSGDAVAARSAGIDAITLTGLDDGIPQPWRSTMADLPVTVDQAILDHAVATAERMIRNLDTAAAGEGEPAQAMR
jgi:hypothetical protein